MQNGLFSSLHFQTHNSDTQTHPSRCQSYSLPTAYLPDRSVVCKKHKCTVPPEFCYSQMKKSREDKRCRGGMDTEMLHSDWDSSHPYSHSNKERLFCCQAGRGVLFNQCQSAEAKLVNGLIGIQGWKICVNLTVVLSNVETVGIDVIAETNKKRVRLGGKLGNQFSSADRYQFLNAVENK